MLRTEARDAIHRQRGTLADSMLVLENLAAQPIEWSVIYGKPVPGAQARAERIALDLLEARAFLASALAAVDRAKSTIGE